MHHSWHDFQPGQQYTLQEVVSACERRIAQGGVIQGDRKQQLVDLLRKHAPSICVWSPFSTGWGASPFNPNCWQTTDRKPVLPEGIEIPELLESDD